MDAGPVNGRERCHFSMLGGERLVHQQEDMEMLVDRQMGRVYVTNYRLLFVPLKKRALSLSIPLGCIAQIDLHYNVFRVLCKNMRLLELCYNDAKYAVSSSMLLSSMPRMQAGALVQPLFILRQSIVDQIATPFAQVTTICRAGDAKPIYVGIAEEMRRLGAGNAWRISTANVSYKLCATYPAFLCVPSGTSDESLACIAAFRSRNRLPVCTWLDRGAALLRSSQPMTGMLRASCPEDEQLLNAVAGMSSAGVLYIVDARSKVAAYANTAKGKGTEITSNYCNCKLLFLGIENIHTIRASHKALFDLMVGQCVSGQASSGWYTGVERTGWMDHVLSLLRGAQTIATLVKKRGASVLIHCSDGWDRTSQLSSLAQLLMDPYYRTLDGFQVLVEKEFLSFGHQFEHRSNGKTLAPSYWSEQEVAPIFAQWIDCVFQMLTQFPTRFEFSQSLLISLLDHSYSNRFATFLGNSEQDRRKYSDVPGFWHWVSRTDQVGRFRNPAYAPMAAQEKMLTLDLNGPAMLTFWRDMYCRFFVKSPGSREYSSSIAAFADTDHITNTLVDDPITTEHVENKDLELTIIDDYCPLIGKESIALSCKQDQQNQEDMSWTQMFVETVGWSKDAISDYVQTWIA